MKSKHFHVTGRVQSVFFRAETQKKAQTLGLTGWVRNCEDGSVEVHAEGDGDALKELEEWLRKGPEGADVESVIVKECEEEGCEGFEIQLP